ncbi:hypothetical protein XSR1_60065 [Xenorhabdus szentirmaii DSM 16338]|uniref:Uncharacterized protein n=1 Tax=Xenorhabdus szentirmaii DSM 16338 TaxID=1427518 RepID=W1J4N7_9GAMM|nr:hypothetical protein XSR1_60065 [Xenorhabdus szentirmaii DSM 16338]
MNRNRLSRTAYDKRYTLDAQQSFGVTTHQVNEECYHNG